MEILPINKMLHNKTAWLASNHVTTWCIQSRKEHIVQKAWHMTFPIVMRIK